MFVDDGVLVQLVVVHWTDTKQVRYLRQLESLQIGSAKVRLNPICMKPYSKVQLNTIVAQEIDGCFLQ